MKYFIGITIGLSILGFLVAGYGGAFFGGLLGAIIGTIVGIAMVFVNKNKEAQEEYLRRQRAEEAAAREAEERQRLAQQRQLEERARKRFQIWKDQELPAALQAFADISVELPEPEDIGYTSSTTPYVNEKFARSCQERLESLRKEGFSADDRYGDYISIYNSSFQNAIDTLKEQIKKAMQQPNLESIETLMRLLYQLRYLTKDDDYEPAAEAVYHFLAAWRFPTTEIAIEEYGTLHTPETEANTDEQIEKIEAEIDNALALAFVNDETARYRSLADHLTTDMASQTEKVMWYYARKKPFNTSKFENACERYGCFTRSCSINSLVEMTARLFAKKELGGELTVRDDQKAIMEWLNVDAQQKPPFPGQQLASAFAAMELYNMEYDVLKELVRQRLQLHPAVQERLKFLADGGTNTVKVYDSKISDAFLFDNSSADWDEKTISTFFRNAKMKKIVPKYSLVISRWKKTMPLLSGQNPLPEKLFESFTEMVEDFDNEVDCIQVSAQAVDLENVNFRDAVLFRFHSDRNRCVTILFYCEKFGRNLNLTILTLFTPDEDLTYEEMEKYAIAIKSNMYVVSFRESILQEVDEILKSKADIYDTDENSTKTIFS